MVSFNIHLCLGLEKHILELSALINYGEFRKRAGSSKLRVCCCVVILYFIYYLGVICNKYAASLRMNIICCIVEMDPKNGKKLNELVHKGYALITAHWQL